MSVCALGHIEDDGVGMKLRRDIAIDRAGGIVLELGGDKLARGLGRMIASDSGLCVTFKLVKGDADAFAVRFADTFIAADKRRQARQIWARKRSRPNRPGVPSS